MVLQDTLRWGFGFFTNSLLVIGHGLYTIKSGFLNNPFVSSRLNGFYLALHRQYRALHDMAPQLKYGYGFSYSLLCRNRSAPRVRQSWKQ
jgi:hypothetical protein